MSFHTYRYGDGCIWNDNMDEAVEHFNSLPMDNQYTAIGISLEGYAVDVVFKGEYGGLGKLHCSGDIKQSILFQEHPYKTIETLKALYKALDVEEKDAKDIIDALTEMAPKVEAESRDVIEEDDDLEEM